MMQTVWRLRRKSVRLQRRSPIHEIKLALPWVDDRFAIGAAELARLMVVSGHLIGHECRAHFGQAKTTRVIKIAIASV
ncbi:hypothetical protein AB7M17_006257 [Bradyrhizobium sp. USDA 377]